VRVPMPIATALEQIRMVVRGESAERGESRPLGQLYRLGI
jgi:hypothetical protein